MKNVIENINIYPKYKIADDNRSKFSWKTKYKTEYRNMYTAEDAGIKNDLYYHL